MLLTVRLRALAALLPITMLAACGGGGGGGGSIGSATPQPNGPLAAYAGVYESHASSEDVQILVHPQGQAVGLRNDRATSSDARFVGTFAVAGTTVQKAGADFYATTWSAAIPPMPTSTPGSADVTLSQPDAAGSMTATITNASIPNPAPTMKATRKDVSVAFLGLPVEKLGGDYIDWETIPARGQRARVDAATGAVTGDYGTNCTIAGTFTGYDNSVAMFLLEASFSGGGCAAQGIPAGTGHFVGYLASSRLGSLELVGVGTIAGTAVTVMLKHNQVLGTY